MREKYIDKGRLLLGLLQQVCEVGALSLQLLSQLCHFSGFPPLQLLLEEQQVDVDDVI